MTTDRPPQGLVEGQAVDFDLLDPDAELSTDEVKRYLKRLYNELGFSRMRLKDARYSEARALRAWKEKRAVLLLSDDCPEISRTENVSRQDRDDWLTGQAPDLWWTYQGAKVVRECAEDFCRTLRDQLKCVQSINATTRQMDELTWRHP